MLMMTRTAWLISVGVATGLVWHKEHLRRTAAQTDARAPQSAVRSSGLTPLLMHLLVLQLLDKGLPGLPISKVLWKGSAVCRRGQAAPWGLSGLDRRGQVA